MCSTVKLAPQAQLVGILEGTHPYLRARASTKVPLRREKPCSSNGQVVNQLDEPLSLARSMVRVYFRNCGTRSFRKKGHCSIARSSSNCPISQNLILPVIGRNFLSNETPFQFLHCTIFPAVGHCACGVLVRQIRNLDSIPTKRFQTSKRTNPAYRFQLPKILKLQIFRNWTQFPLQRDALPILALHNFSRCWACARSVLVRQIRNLDSIMTERFQTSKRTNPAYGFQLPKILKLQTFRNWTQFYVATFNCSASDCLLDPNAYFSV